MVRVLTGDLDGGKPMSCLCPERLLQFVFAVWVLSLLSALAVAQQVDVAVRPPHFIGEPALIQVIVQGLDEDPQPTCGVERTVPGLDLQSRCRFLVSLFASVFLVLR